MKNFAARLVCLGCFAITTSSFAQGLIVWNNTSGSLISVNGASMPPNNPPSPATSYYFGLFIAPVGTPAPGPGWAGIDDPNWQSVVAYTMNSTAAAGAGRMLNSGAATVPGYGPGTNVHFIVRYWQSSSGTTNWQAAKQGFSDFGTSSVGTATLGGGAFPIPSAFGPNPGQISGFGNVICLSCGYVPWFEVNPPSKSVALGTDVTLFALAKSQAGSPIGYQWRKNGANITGATTTSLSLTNVQLADAGNYDVVASNTYGSTPSAVATLTVFIPAIPATLSSPTYTIDSQFRFTVTGSSGSNYVVQVATNLASPTTWLSLFTNASPFTFVDSNAQNFPQRFYRAMAH